MPRFQYFYQNFSMQFLIILRTFFSFLSPPYFKFIIFFLMFYVLYLITPVTYAAQIALAWDASEGSVAGYKIHYGTKSGDYDYSVNVGNYTSCTISDLQEGTTYYFSATAYNSYLSESDFSEEIEYTIPITLQPYDSTISESAIYVLDSSIDLYKKGPNYFASAFVIVWDDMDRPVKGAIVSGQWFLNGKFISEVSDSSDKKGVAKLILNKVRAQSGDQLTLIITDVVKYDYIYDFDSNIADEISINFP